MSELRALRLKSLLAWLEHEPLLLFSEEQIGAYLLDLVPANGPLKRDDRETARRQARWAMTPYLESGEVIRIGLAVTVRHTQPRYEIHRIPTYRQNPLVDLLVDYFQQNKRDEASVDFNSGEVDRTKRAPRVEEDIPALRETILTPTQFKVAENSPKQRTWFYASKNMKAEPWFKSRYTARDWDSEYLEKHPKTDECHEEFWTRQQQEDVYHGHEYVSPWIRAQEYFAEFEDMHDVAQNPGIYEAELLTAREYNLAGDCIVSMLRHAEKVPGFWHAMTTAYFFLHLLHGYIHVTDYEICSKIHRSYWDVVRVDFAAQRPWTHRMTWFTNAIVITERRQKKFLSDDEQNFIKTYWKESSGDFFSREYMNLEDADYYADVISNARQLDALIVRPV